MDIEHGLFTEQPLWILCLDNLELLCFAHQFKRNLKRPLLELYWPLAEWTWPCKPQLVITKKVLLFLLSGLPMDDDES